MKSEIFFFKTFFKIKAIFSSSNNEESSSIKSVNDRLVQHLLEENKTKNDIFKIIAGNFSVNVNKPQNTNFSLQLPQNDIANSETSISSVESRHKSILSIPKEPAKSSSNNNQNQNAPLSESHHYLIRHQGNHLLRIPK